jgi:hypothetical protein
MPGSKAGETWKEKAMNFACEVSLFIPVGFLNLTCYKLLQHETDGFTSPPKKPCYRFLSPLKIHYP